MRGRRSADRRHREKERARSEGKEEHRQKTQLDRKREGGVRGRRSTVRRRCER